MEEETRKEVKFERGAKLEELVACRLCAISASSFLGLLSPTALPIWFQYSTIVKSATNDPDTTDARLPSSMRSVLRVRLRASA